MKRENGAGSVYQRADGRWVAQVWDHAVNKYRYAYAQTKNKARARLREMLNDLESGKSAVDTSVQLQEFGRTWIEARASHRRKQSTVHEYDIRLEAYVYPAIGSLQLGKVTVSDIEAVFDALRKRGLSHSTIKGVKAALSALYTDARRDRVVRNNPVRDSLTPLSDPAPERPVPTTDEVLTMLASPAMAVGGDHGSIARLMALLALTGARVGEALGSKWDDIDLEKGTWTIGRTVARGRNGGSVLGTTTKNSRSRKVALMPEVVSLLRMQQQIQRSYVAETATRWTDNGLVFPSAVGTVWEPSNARRVMRRTFPEWKYDFHALRHWCVSVLIEGGAQSGQVAKVVGHSSSRITDDTYSHLLDGTGEQVMSGLGRYAEVLRFSDGLTGEKRQ